MKTTLCPQKRRSTLGLFLLSAMLVPATAGAASFCVPGAGDRPETGLQGAVPLSERLAANGGFKGFWCGARKVAQDPLWNRGSYGENQQIGHCAYSSMRDPSDLNAPTTGTVVFDVSVPRQPKMLSILRTPAMIRAYSALEISGNIMVAAFKDFGPNGTNPLDVYDVSDCKNPVMLSTSNVASGNHDGWLTEDTNTYYGVPFGGQTILQNPNRIDIHVTDLSDKAHPKPLLNWNRLSLPADVYERTKGTFNFHDISTNRAGTRAYMALYGGTAPLGGTGGLGAEAGRCANGLMIMDTSDIALRRPNPQMRFISFTSWCDQQIDPDFGDGSTGSAHATEYVIHENGKEYVVTTDESAGGLAGNASGVCSQRSYARMIDIADELHPKIVGTFKPDVNKPANCPANLAADTNGGMVHYLGFQDRYNMRLVVYAGANQGIRFVDWRDPTSPKEIAYYVKERHETTAVNETDFTRPDPRYDTNNCIFYTGWNQGGVVSVELTNPEYNPCLRRDGTIVGYVADAQTGDRGANKIVFQAKRSGDTLVGKVQLQDRTTNTVASINTLTSLGAVLDRCGSVEAAGDSIQVEGTGTLNGAPASFRACMQKGNTGGGSGARPGQFYLTCTAGCSYEFGGALHGSSAAVFTQN